MIYELDTNFMPCATTRRVKAANSKREQDIKDIFSFLRVVLFWGSNEDSPSLIAEVQMFGELSDFLFKQ